MISNRIRALRTTSWTEIAVLCIGCALIAAAAAANRTWVDRHFLPSYWTPHDEIVRNAMRARVALALAGLLIVALGRKVGRALARQPRYAVPIPLAVVLALGATELVLRRQTSTPTEPRTHADARLGWLIDPSRTGTVTLLGHRT